MPENRRSALDARRRRVAARRVAEVQSQRPAGRAARQQQAMRLRAARRPAAAYGAAVRRRLRGRWFNLVPVRRRSLAAFYLALAGLSLLLVAGHWGSLHAAWLADHARLARPLRLDLAGGLGDWAGCQLLSLAAGAAFLIYQLRRHRGDDYRGRYRMWRPMILLLIVASIDAVARIRDVPAAVVDALLADPQLIAGDDVARLALLLVGGLLAVPLIAEMRRSPGGGVLVLLGLAGMALPTAVRLEIVSGAADSAGLLSGGGLLAGRACVLAAAVTYLRRLYLEVRGETTRRESEADAPAATAREPAAARWRLRLRRPAAEDASSDRGKDDADAEDPPRRARRRLWPLPRRRSVAVAPEDDATAAADEEEHAAADSDGADTDTAGEKGAERSGRRLRFRLPMPNWRGRAGGGDAETGGAAESTGDRRRASKDDSATADGEAADGTASTGRRRWLPWKRRAGEKASPGKASVNDPSSREAAASEPEQPTTPSEENRRRPPEPRGASAESTRRESTAEGETETPEEVDLSKLSKSERRRMRKLLRRQGKAA